jgi:hypothetical protein
MRRLACAAVLATILACGGGGLEPPNPVELNIVGTYSAVQLNGVPLPTQGFQGLIAPGIPSAIVTASVLTIGEGQTQWSRTVTYTANGVTQTKTDGGTMIRNTFGFVLSSGGVDVLGILVRDQNTLDVGESGNFWVFTR